MGGADLAQPPRHLRLAGALYRCVALERADAVVDLQRQLLGRLGDEAALAQPLLEPVVAEPL